MPRFRKTYIEITNACDLSCSFCSPAPRAPKFMGRELFTRILGQLDGIAGLLHLHVMGEPTLHPELSTFLDECHTHGFSVNLVTNGWNLAGHAEMLLEKRAIRQLSVSAHSLLGNVNPPDYDAYFGAIAEFARRAAASASLAVSIRLWARNERIDARRESDVFAAIERAFSLSHALAHALEKSSSARIAQNVHCNCAPEFEWPSLDKPLIGDQGSCRGLRDQCAVLVDGTVTACCLDRDGIIALGNVNDEQLSAILAGSRAKSIRAGFTQGYIVEELCKRCSYRLRF